MRLHAVFSTRRTSQASRLRLARLRVPSSLRCSSQHVLLAHDTRGIRSSPGPRVFPIRLSTCTFVVVRWFSVHRTTCILGIRDTSSCVCRSCKSPSSSSSSSSSFRSTTTACLSLPLSCFSLHRGVTWERCTTPKLSQKVVISLSLEFHVKGSRWCL